ncbi:TraB/GumN family protein [Gaoshiqia sp. Z1-71]|uniref:TraB/GumN family protein n=1 Tax=Gaoshiqia hydrogeniformans TaxID=3290090 RepID=UPI003BF839F1
MNWPPWKLVFGKVLIAFLFCSCSSNIGTDGGLLWRISGNGLKEPSYLFGTNHGMSGDFLGHIPGFFEALDSVKQLAVESDPTRPKRLDSIKPLNKFLPTDISYPDLLDESELAVLDSILFIYSTLNSEEMNLNPNFLFN